MLGVELPPVPYFASIMEIEERIILLYCLDSRKWLNGCITRFSFLNLNPVEWVSWSNSHQKSRHERANDGLLSVEGKKKKPVKVWFRWAGKGGKKHFYKIRRRGSLKCYLYTAESCDLDWWMELRWLEASSTRIDVRAEGLTIGEFAVELWRVTKWRMFPSHLI